MTCWKVCRIEAELLDKSREFIDGEAALDLEQKTMGIPEGLFSTEDSSGFSELGCPAGIAMDRSGDIRIAFGVEGEMPNAQGHIIAIVQYLRDDAFVSVAVGALIVTDHHDLDRCILGSEQIPTTEFIGILHSGEWCFENTTLIHFLAISERIGDTTKGGLDDLIDIGLFSGHSLDTVDRIDLHLTNKEAGRQKYEAADECPDCSHG